MWEGGSVEQSTCRGQCLVMWSSLARQILWMDNCSRPPSGNGLGLFRIEHILAGGLVSYLVLSWNIRPERGMASLWLGYFKLVFTRHRHKPSHTGYNGTLPWCNCQSKSIDHFSRPLVWTKISLPTLPVILEPVQYNVGFEHASYV